MATQSFRNIDVFPLSGEVNKRNCPDLQKNVIKGSYNNLEHYLDVQFRLNREDFVAPLREGICEYLEGRAEEEVPNIKIHKNVCCIGISPNQGQLGYLLQVFDPKSIPDLETSKRFMYGAMVCLSDNHFKHIIFGRIIDCDHLKAGCIVVSLAHNDLMDTSKMYTLAECTVYFEPYFHVLNALQTIHALPMKKYLIRVSGIETNIGEHSVSTWTRFGLSLGLNSSQQEAYAAALTKELCIIQGPPGTGKTHLSLHVTRQLINQYRGRGPILIICFTNHALDQFLEGLLDSPRKLIRVGGQSKNEKLKEYSLNSVKEENKRKVKLGQRAGEQRRCLNTLENQLRHEAYVMGVIYKLRHVTDFDYFYYIDNSLCNYKKSWLVNASVEKIMAWLFTESLSEELSMNSNYKQGKSEKVTWRTSKCLPFAKDIFRELGTHVLLRFGTLSAISQSETVKNRVINSFKIPTIPTKENWLHVNNLLQRHLLAQIEKLRNVQQQYQKAYDEYRKITEMLDLRVLRNAEVIGMTTTSAARMHNTLKQLGCKIVIIEEAAECLEAHIVTALSPSCGKLILVGDHKQLRPSTADYYTTQKYHLDISLFERMVDNGVRCYTLNEQHRMRPEIASLISPSIYPILKNAAKVQKYPPVRGISKSLYFITHQHREEAYGDSSKKNRFEAEYLIRLALYLVRNRYKPKEITMLATYSGQWSEMQRIKERYPTLDNMRISTVDNFQGEENDIILLSLVRNNREGVNGFLKLENRVCVALSRARHGLYIMGNMPQLIKGNTIWEKVQQALRNNDSLGEFLTVHCVNHPSSKTYLREIADIDKLLSSSCGLPCGRGLRCGHKCNMRCHMDNIVCRCDSPCEMILCHNGHVCPKRCGLPCGNCMVPMDRTFSCGHTDEVRPCYQVQSKCNKQVLLALPCGHQSSQPCFAKDEYWKCTKQVLLTLPCGHQSHRPCIAKNEYWKCTKQVLLTLPCGHQSSQPCFTKNEDWKCTEQVLLTLPCGHQSYRPCIAKNEYRKCTKQVLLTLPCGHQSHRPCIAKNEYRKCTKQVLLTLPCGHQSSQPCFTKNEDWKCTEQVLLTLPCGHQSYRPCIAKDEGRKCKQCSESVNNIELILWCGILGFLYFKYIR